MKLLCVDGNSVLNRAFYGIKLLTTKDGRYTNAVYGFMNIFLKLLESLQPERVAVAFDLPGGTFRNRMYSGYKANRKGMPDELVPQLREIKELLGELGYPVVTAQDYEADDILGSISLACEEAGIECRIATGDRDSLQLVSEQTHVLLTTTHFGRGETEEYDPTAVEAKYGVTPLQFIDVKALMGDASDNIPGVAGVGEKTATMLISAFGTLDGVYENLDDPRIKAGVRAKLERDKEQAYMSRELATIDRHVPIVNRDIDIYVKSEGDPQAASRRLAALEMTSILSRLDLPAPTAADRAEASEPRREVVAEECPEGFIPEGPIYLFQGSECTTMVCGERVLRLRKDAMHRLFPDENIKKICADSKVTRKTAMSIGAELDGVDFDINLAGYLLNPGSGDYGIEKLAGEYGIAPAFDCGEEPLAGLMQPLYRKMAELVEDQGMLQLLKEIEMPLVRVLCEMEDVGFHVDLEGIREFGEELDGNAYDEEQEIYLLAGKNFNINSPKQLGEVLFDTLGLPALKKTKSGYSTSAEILERLRPYHPIIDHIFNYRKYVKLSSTYVEGLTKAADAEGRVHTDFKQTETRTGRISSREPNLQNIPVRTELGSRMWKYFVAGEGRMLVDADYSQIELRVLAHMSGDENMAEAFGEGRDVHTETAARVFGVPAEMVSPELRRRAKAVNFGIIYGIGPYSLSQDIGVSVQEASDYIESYFAGFPKVKKYLEKTVNEAQEKGYVKTLYGRRRYLPELAASNKNIQALGKRLAMNTPVQGTAADIIKIAMIRVADRLRKESYDARLILQVHDELIIECAEEDAQAVAELLRYEMEKAADLRVPLVAEAGVGRNWYDAK